MRVDKIWLPSFAYNCNRQAAAHAMGKWYAMDHRYLSGWAHPNRTTFCPCNAKGIAEFLDGLKGLQGPNVR